ncbi:DNA repair protein RecN [Fontisphaera persica]|uniref:DNA repair protein RecN n=1 Tax=Fontisphaera persica TaxID=2974023 RepID=UPI0024BF8582|nr:DNA repair protein RecN [Fontisphaera persica]WCJ59500.1 DNA repair protein RecN [Fontisphaera persica]
MLTTLRIKNLALVEELTLELAPGLTVITGETGAGKSMLIGALNLVLGERADRTLLRAGCEQCVVEAVFEVGQLRAPLKALLEENGLEPCEGGELLLKRVFTAAGANRQFINGSPAALAILAELGQWLVDIHGPHDHQSLLHPARQLELLDAFGRLEPQRQAFAEALRRRQELLSARAALIVDERTYAQRLDLLRHQVREITAARLQPGEEETLAAEHARASNAARLAELAQGALEALAESDEAALSRLGAVGRALQELQRLDATAAPLAVAHQEAVERLQELQRELRHYADHLDLDPGRLQELEERVNLLHSLRRKYGATVEQILEFGRQAAQELQQLEQRDVELERLQRELAEVEKALKRAGAELTRLRQQSIPRLCRAVAAQLKDLGFKESRLEATLATGEAVEAATLSGLDTVEFLFAPNPGEPPRPLRAIASSGEMARVMLAIKTVLAEEDRVPVLVFDEVDANVGGETARAVGEKMAHIARRHQVLCITHLPQVAAAATHHYRVTKETVGGRTVTRIERLDKKGRIEELTRMLGGGTAARRHAEEMIQP